MENINELKLKIKELEKKVKVSKQSLEQFSLIKKKHKEALEFLAKQKQFTASVIESNQNAIIAIDKNEKVVIFNNSAEKIFGFTKKEMLNKNTLHNIVPDKFLKSHQYAVNNFIQTKKSIGIINNQIELEGKKKDGTLFPIRISFGVDLKDDNMIIIANIDDITVERKQLQILQQQSKLASMGEMIGAIAHQWRQPLSTVSTSIQNLEYDFEDGYLNDEKFVERFIEKNKKTIKFMSRTIDDFRGFFRLDKEKQDFNVKEITQSVIEMQSAQLKSYNILLNLVGDEFIYYGFQSEYSQVILNIINNAKDALIQNNIQNPTIDIDMKDKIVTITDNAGGIPKNIIDRIFEPYFTTKEQGKGTGMGLYMSKMIVEENMQAKLYVENIENGAMFIINLKDINE